MNIVPKL